MANTFTIAGSATLVLDGIRSVGNLSSTVNLVGSNATFRSQNITASAWSSLDTGSLSDNRYGWFYHDGDSGSITLAGDSAGTKPMAILYPGDVAVVPWSGSNVSLYAKITNNENLINDVVLQYMIAEK